MDSDYLRICRFNRPTADAFRSYLESIATASHGSTANYTFDVPNGSGGTIAAGSPISLSGSQALLGNASSQAASVVDGVASAAAAPTLTVTAIYDGPITLTTAQWDARTGQSGGLSAGAVYYLGASPGTLTTTPPSAVGLSIVKLGRALNATTLLVEIERPILL